ncbi:MAG: hypothetical protein ACI4PF_04320, partial [Christensenellales bacterium]
FASIFSLFGCATIESIRVVNPDYSIIDKLVVTLDESKLNKAGKSLDEVRTSIYSDMINFRNYVDDWIDSFSDDYPEIFIILKNGIYCQVPESTKRNEISVVIEFAGIEYFRIFYGLETVTEELQNVMNSESYKKAMNDIGPFITKICNNDYKTEGMGLFLYKYFMFSDNGLMSGIKDFSLSGNGESYYEKYSNLTNYTLDDVQINQIFTYPDDRIKSNADDVEVLNGMTFMAWDLSNKEEGFEMSIYYVAAKTTSWYIVGLLVSAIAVVIIFFCIKKKYKNAISVKITKQEIEKNER